MKQTIAIIFFIALGITLLGLSVHQKRQRGWSRSGTPTGVVVRTLKGGLVGAWALAPTNGQGVSQVRYSIHDEHLYGQTATSIFVMSNVFILKPKAK